MFTKLHFKFLIAQLFSLLTTDEPYKARSNYMLVDMQQTIEKENTHLQKASFLETATAFSVLHLEQFPSSGNSA